MKTITGHKGIFTNDTLVQVCTYACKLPHTRRSGTNISRLLQFRFPHLLLGCLEVVVLLSYLSVFLFCFLCTRMTKLSNTACAFIMNLVYFLRTENKTGGGGGILLKYVSSTSQILLSMKIRLSLQRALKLPNSAFPKRITTSHSNFTAN